MAAILPTTEGINLVWSMWPGYLTPDNPVVRFSEEHGLTIRTVHTSGHATAEDLKRLAVAVNPRAVIPIHTEHPELYPTLYPKVLRLEDGVNHAL
jgi:ribonuclease J